MNKTFMPYSFFALIKHLLRSKKFYKNLTALLCNFAIILNSFLPYISAIPAYAQEADLTPTPTVEEVSAPSPEPTIIPTTEPTVTIEPTLEPTLEPTIVPTITETPTASPTAKLTEIPTIVPTEIPVDNSNQPSDQNSSSPTTQTPTSVPSPTSTPTPVFTAVSGQIETVVVENNSCRTDILNPLLSSDKADYSPTEIAIITGHGFLTNTEYKLKISSDGPEGTSSINETYTINTDSKGNFTYSYQLDGNYRPNYLVEAFDLSGTLIASLTFTDSQNPQPQPPQRGKIIVTKIVVGGSLTANNFNITGSGSCFNSPVNYNGSSTGQIYECKDNGNIPHDYNITETPSTGYTVAYSTGCSGNITRDQIKYCTVTNTYISKTNTSVSLYSNINPSVYGQSVTFTSTVTGGSTPTGTVTFKDGSTTLYTQNLSGASASYSTNSLSVGSHNITATYSGDSSHNGSTSTILIQNVTKANQSINFATLSNKTFGDAPFTLSATATSGLPVSFNIVSGPATLSGNTLTITGVGTVTVRASQTGDSNYNAAPNVDRTFTINKATPVLTWSDPADIVYGTALSSTQLNAVANVGGTFVYSPSLGTILHTGDNQHLSVTFYPTDTNYNYISKTVHLDVKKAPLTIAADPQSKIYGNFDPFFTYKFSGFVNGDDKYDLDLWPICFVPAPHFDVGIYTISCYGGFDDNYFYKFQDDFLSINKRQLTPHITVKNKIYDATTSAEITNMYLTGILQYDQVSLIGGTALFDTKDVGNNKNVTISGLSLTGHNSSNYSIGETATTTANITVKTITVTADSNQSKIFGALDPLFTFTSDTLALGDTLSGTLGRVAGEDVGTYALTLGTLTAGDNYSVEFIPADFTINSQSNSSSSTNSSSNPPGAPVCNESAPSLAPMNFRAVAGKNSVTLYWDKPNTNFTYYLIAYSDQASADKYGNPNIGGPNTTSYTVGDLSAGTTYYFKIRTGNGCAPGPFSTIVSATPGGQVLTNTIPSGFEPGVLGTQTTENSSPLGTTNTCTPIFPFVFVLALIINLILNKYRLLTFFVSVLSLIFDYLINKYSCVKHPYYYFANLVSFLLPLIISFRKTKR